MMCSVALLRRWSLTVFLLCSPVALKGKPADALSSRMRRSVSHAQLMHDKGHSLQVFKRQMWLQELLEEVHTANERAPSVQNRSPTQTFSGSDLFQKLPGATKNLPDKLDREGPNLPQETNKVVSYQDQPLKVATKRKKKVRLSRRRESEKKRRRARSATTEACHQD